MNRQEKKTLVDSITRDFKQSKASFVVGMQGMTVEHVQKLRNELYEKHGRIKVAKNTLLKRATDGLEGIDKLQPFFKGQIAVIFADEDAPSIAKILVNAAKRLEMLKLQGGTLDTNVISLDKIKFLASLPSREVLLSTLCGTLQAPISSYVRILNQLIVRLLWVLKEIETKKQ